MSPTASVAASVWRQLPFFVWLIALWMLLWGQFTVLAAVTGVVVALVVTRVFRLPGRAVGTGEPLVRRGLRGDVLPRSVRGSLLVAWQTLNPRRYPGTAVIAVPLRTDDDLIMAHVGVTASLIPGSLIIDVDRDRRILYLHVIGVSSDGCRESAPRRAGLGGAHRARRRVARAARGDPRGRARRARVPAGERPHRRRSTSCSPCGLADAVAHRLRTVDPRPRRGIGRAADPRHVRPGRGHGDQPPHRSLPALLVIAAVGVFGRSRSRASSRRDNTDR
jgi:multicomponent Na+:H+ antiporter subunit E